MVEYHPMFSKDQSKLHLFGIKGLAGIFLGCALYAGWIWNGDIMVADIEELEEMDASELHARRLTAGKCYRHWEVDTSFPVRRWNSQNLWERTASENIHLDPGSVWNEEKKKKFFKENQMNYILQPHFKKTRRGDERKLTVTSGLLQEKSFIVITLNQSQTLRVERRIMSYSVEVHRRYQNNKIITGRFVEQKNWRVLERGWRKRIVRCTDRLHKIHLFEWNAIWWVRMVRRSHKETNNPLVPTMYGQICGSMSDAAKKKAKQRWAIEKPKLDNARQLRRIFFIEPNDEEFKLTMKAARRKVGSSDASSNALQIR